MWIEPTPANVINFIIVISPQTPLWGLSINTGRRHEQTHTCTPLVCAIKPKSVHSLSAPSARQTITTAILNAQLHRSALGQTGWWHVAVHAWLHSLKCLHVQLVEAAWESLDRECVCERCLMATHPASLSAETKPAAEGDLDKMELRVAHQWWEVQQVPQVIYA